MLGNRLKMDQEDNCMVLLHGLHFGVTQLKHRVPHWGCAAFGQTLPFNTPWRHFPALEFISRQVIGISAKSPLFWSLRGKREVVGGKERSKEGKLSSTSRNDQMTQCPVGRHVRLFHAPPAKMCSTHVQRYHEILKRMAGRMAGWPKLLVMELPKQKF